MNRLYNEKDDIELTENIIVSRDGYYASELEQENIQKKKRGKKHMFVPMIAETRAKGLINKNDYMYGEPLMDIMEEYFVKNFHQFIRKTLCRSMDDFGVIEAKDSTMIKMLIEKHKKENGSEITEQTVFRYLKLLRDADVLKKINNKMYVVNPYQLYKNATISGERLWQLQANWELGKVMTKWLDISDEERLDILEKKALLDAKWAKEKKEEIIKDNEEIKKVYEDKDGKYLSVLMDFIEYAKKHSDEWEFYENQSIIKYLEKDSNVRKFRNWYMRWTKDERSKDRELKFDYNMRGSYRDAFVEIAKRHNTKDN